MKRKIILNKGLKTYNVLNLTEKQAEEKSKKVLEVWQFQNEKRKKKLKKELDKIKKQ